MLPNSKFHIPYSNNRGFTMLEMLVSLAVFSVAAVIAVGALVRMTGLNRQAQSLQSAMNSVSFALESMSREMRVGTSYNCDTTNTYFSSVSANTCNGGDSNTVSYKRIAFKSSKTALDVSNNPCSLIYAYWFIKNGSVWNIKKSQQTSCGDLIKYDTATTLIDDANVTISDFDLSVKSGANGYSYVTVELKGYAGKKDSEKEYFDIRTLISQRIAG